MRKSLKCFMTVVFLLVNVVELTYGQTSGGGGGGSSSSADSSSMNSWQDSERAAQIYGGLNIERYDGGFGFNRYDQFGRYIEFVSASYQMNKQKQFTYLEIGGITIVDVQNGDDPLFQIPANANGEARDFFFYVYGYDQNGQSKVYGNFQKSLWLGNEPIVVTLKPLSVREFVAFFLPKGVDASDVYLKTNDFDNAFPVGYDTYSHGFWVFVNPLKMVEYSIVDESTGIIWRYGVIDPLNNNPVVMNMGSAVSLLFEGGVQEISLSNEHNQAFLPAQGLDGHVERLCTSPAQGTCMVEAAVYHMEIEQHGLFISFYSDIPLIIEVYQWMEAGDMPLIASSRGGNNEYVQIRTGYDRVVVTVVPVDGSAYQPGVDDSFEINFYRIPAPGEESPKG